MPQITPTVSRKVWFYVGTRQHEPMDATIVKVYGEGPDAAVNLHVKDPNGPEVTFWSSVHVGTEETNYPHYRWMPYQQGQADKAAREEGGKTPPPAMAAPIATAAQEAKQEEASRTKGT